MLNPSKVRDDRACVAKGGKAALLVHLLDPSSDAEHDASAQSSVVTVKSKPHEIQRFIIKLANLPVALHMQPVFFELLRNLLSYAVQFFLASTENNHVVHIAQIVLCVELLLDIVVDIGNKEVRKDLRQKHSYRQPV